jgi:serine/threonine protein kinase
MGTAVPKLIGKLLGHYRLVERIGVGGMGEVYLAHDEQLDRHVALKVLPHGKLSDEQARRRFRREAHALSRLNHPHIATVHEFGSDDGIDYLVMEHIEGPTLDERLTEGPMSEEELLRIASQLAEAVGEAHEQGVIHRDLKPANIKLTRKGQVKVLDFGLARLLNPEPGSSQELTPVVLGGIAGTVPYMAPEQFGGQEPSPPSDVWALGAVLYQAASRRPPFEGKTIADLVASIVHETPRALPDTTSANLRAIIERCLRKEPGQRYQHAGELHVALDTIRSGSRLLPIEKSRRWRSTRWIGLAASLIAAAAVGFVAIRGIGSGAGVANSTIESIVALPSRVQGEDEDGFLTDALPQTMTTQLSRVEGLVTKMPPTSVAFARLEDDLVKAAEAYDVAAFVLSSVRTQDDQLFLNVQLVDATNQQVMWGGDFEGTKSGYVELVREAADGLLVAISPSAQPLAAGAARSSEAELELQRGLYHLNLFYTSSRTEDFERATSAFERARALDPTFADAAAGTAQIELLQIVRGGDPIQVFDRTEVWARLAIQLDPQSSQAWQLLSALEDLRPDGDRRASLEYALKAVTYGPQNNYAYAALANALMSTSSSLTVAAYTEAQRQHPLDLSSLAATAGPLNLLGDHDEALARVERVLRIEPDLPYALMTRTLIQTVHGDMTEAGAGLTRLEQLASEGRLPPNLYGFARDLVDLTMALETGDDESAAPVMDRLLKLSRGQGDLFTFWDRATQAMGPLLSKYGYTDRAMQLLSDRLELGITMPYDVAVWNPALSPLLGNPRFENVLTSARERFEEVLQILEEARARDELPAFLDQALTDLQARLRSEAAL